MNDFTILHLSDLHINGQGVLSRLMKNLLSDIESEMRDVENIILVVTGDILDKAQYDDYEDNVVQFFTQLKNILGNKLKVLLVSQFVTNQICSHVTDLPSFVSLAFLYNPADFLPDYLFHLQCYI